MSAGLIVSLTNHLIPPPIRTTHYALQTSLPVSPPTHYTPPMRIALLAPFGLHPKGTVSARMLPLAEALAGRGHLVRVLIPPWDDPSARAGSSISSVDMGADRVAGVHIVTLPLPRRGPYSARLASELVRAAFRPSGYACKGMGVAERALASFRAEVAHVFKPVGYSGLAGLALW